MTNVPRIRSNQLGWLITLSLSLSAAGAAAQVPPPPLPPPVDETDAGADASSGEPATTSSASAASAAPQAGSQASSTSASGAASATAAGDTSASSDISLTDPNAGAAEAQKDSDEEAAEWMRLQSTRLMTTISGSTGLMHVHEAGSGAAGTFRINLVGSYFSARRFLCDSGSPCTDPVTGLVSVSDSAQSIEANANISVTPWPFLEAFMSIHNSATSNSQGNPQNVQVVGDTYFGLKGFMPHQPDRVYAFGGEAQLDLLTGMGGLGVAGPATSVALRGLATLDLNNRTKKEDRIPLRAHLNLAYRFDNSGKVVEDIENTAPPAGRGAPIARTERFGLGISRVDSFELGLATEYVHPYFRPFVEWSLDVAVNRQKYVCNIQGAASRGDRCLGGVDSDGKKEARLGAMPSRLTLGARVFPWQRTGLAITGAVDIGTGATNRFLEEVTPEAPYNLWLGLGYTVDTVEKKPKEVMVPSPIIAQQETRRYIIGQVVEEKSGVAIADAVIRYQDVPMTGLVANANGEFITQDLPPGSYTFTLYAEEFRDGTCTATIPENAAPLQPANPTTTTAPANEPAGAFAEVDDAAQAEPSTTQDDSAAAPADSSTQAPYMDEDGNVLVPVVCKMKELPHIANVTGLIVDAQSGGPVSDATVTITDKLNRSLRLEVDESGAFQFRNVPFGSARLRANAPGYLPTVLPLVIESRDELKPTLLLNPRPERLGVTVGKSEVKLARSVEFVGDTVEVAVSSMSILEELAVVLTENEDLGSIEIQVHSDDTGAASYARRLSQERADHIRTLLIDLGVRPSTLTAKGYGPDQPLAPNVSDANRKKNNRVQFILGAN